MNIKQLAFGLLTIGLISCNSTPKENIKHSFFIAGHTYGKPAPRGEKELFKPFKAKFDFINEQQEIAFGVLLGDVVRYPNSWPNVIEELEELSMPIHIARGNHDGKLETFEKMFGPSYKKFSIKNDLFIILDPNIDKWNISGKQLDFLKKTLKEEGKEVTNIFVFMHQLIWYSKDIENFNIPKPNSLQNKDVITNYWEILEPLFIQTKKPVYLMAGDVGAFYRPKSKNIIEYSLHKKENITYITTGMGGGTRDNFIILDIYKDNSVKYRLVHLNGEDIKGLGELKLTH